MHTIRIKPIEGNLSNNAYSTVATKGKVSTVTRSDLESSGSRRAYAAFYGIEPDQISKTAYARCKQALTSSLPQKVQTSAFNYGEARENKINSREERLRNPNLASVGKTIVNTDSRTFQKATKAFYLLPSSHASKVASDRPLSHQSSLNQQEHLKEIVGQDGQIEKELAMFYAGSTPKPNALGPRQFENYKYIDTEVKGQRQIESSSSSFKAAQKRFYAIDSKVSPFNLNSQKYFDLNFYKIG